MRNRFRNEIENSINNTVIYRENTFKEEKAKGVPAFRLVSAFSQEAAFEYKEGKTAILVFASYNNPGGGFIGGSMAQEESLCHDSFLYNVLERHIHFYETNRKSQNRSLYKNVALYIPDVMFFSDEESSLFDVVVCPAPNYRAAKDKGVTKEENSKALLERIKFLKGIAEENKVDTFILGAFGCGVFGQEAEEVADIFIDIFSNSSIKNIVFAVPEGRDGNYRGFEKAWENLEEF